MSGYIRVSKVGGREGESFISPRVQRGKIEAWAKLHDVVLSEVEEDLDVSGGSAPEERKLEKLLRRCEQGVSSGIVTWRVDRFSRSAADTLMAVKRLQACGARLVGVDDGVDTDSPGGKLILTVLAGLAESQLDTARENWRVARAEAAGRGVYLSGHLPTGFTRGESGGLAADPESAEVIAEAFKRRAAGESFTAVSDFLSESGVLPRAGGRGTRTRWSREGARQLLRNPVYCGRPEGANAGASVAAIVSPAEWRAAQIPTRAYASGSGRTRALLVGLAKCGGCGHALHAQGRGPSYACRGRFASGLCPARAVASVKRVDDFVVTEFAAHESEAPGPSLETAWLAAKAAMEAAEAELDAWVTDTSLRERLGARFAKGIDARVVELEKAQRAFYDVPDPQIPADATIVAGHVYELFGESIDRDREILRRSITAVTVHRADPARRKWQAIEERVEIAWR